MASGMLMIENQKEAQILKLGFEQTGVKVVLSKADYKNYTLSLQFMPDFLIMELPRICVEQMHIAGLLRKHQRFKGFPIIGYGAAIDDSVRRGILRAGVSVYLDRPLKFSGLTDLIEKLLKPYKKTIVSVKAEEKKQKHEQDYEKIMGPETPPAAKLDLMVHYVSRLLAFPFTVAKVQHITNDEKSGAGHLAQAISADPTISANILKVSNSVFFASVNRRIGSIKEAIVRIGFLETKKFVMGMMVYKLFSESTQNLGFNRIDFWYHSLAAGLFAERMAKFMSGVNPEMAFLAGLLHDIGVIILDEYFPAFFSAALKDTSAKGGHFPERETALFGVNHNDLVGKLFPVWKIPDEITGAIVNHCRLADQKTDLDSVEKKLTFCVMMGNLLAKVAFYGRECDKFVWPVENWAFESARVGNVITQRFIGEIDQQVEQFRSFLKLETRDYTADIKAPDGASDVPVGIVNLADHFFVPVEQYLLRKGFTVQRLNESDAVKHQHTIQLGLVIVWAGRTPVTKDTLAPYAKFEKISKTPIPGGEKNKMAPILCILSPDCAEADGLPPEISFLSNRLDLRELDQAMEKVKSGGTVRSLANPLDRPKP